MRTWLVPLALMAVLAAPAVATAQQPATTRPVEGLLQALTYGPGGACQPSSGAYNLAVDEARQEVRWTVPNGSFKTPRYSCHLRTRSADFGSYDFGPENLCTGKTTGTDEQGPYVQDKATGQRTRFDAGVRLLALSPDCAFVVGQDGAARVYTTAGQLVSTFDAGGDMTKVTMSRDDSVVVWLAGGRAFARHLALGQTYRLDFPDALTANTSPGAGAAVDVAAGATGHLVAFTSKQSDLVPGDADGGDSDVFLRQVDWRPHAITGLSGRCVAGASIADGARVELQDCAASAAQTWVRRGDGTVRIGGECLDAKDYGRADGTPVQLWTCGSGQGNQRWVPQADGTLRNPVSGRCLDAKDHGTAAGTPLQLWGCAASENQKWVVPPVTGEMHASSGSCIAAVGYPRPPVSPQDCDGSASRLWTRYADGTIRNSDSGLCVDATDFGTANDTRIQAYGCSAEYGNGNQKWVPGANGSLVNVAAGRCLDGRDGDVGRFAVLALEDCDGSDTQIVQLPRLYADQ